MTQERLTAFEDVAALATVGATYPELMLYLQSEIEKCKAVLAQPTSGDYALGYAEGFNDACKPKPAQDTDHGDELTIAYMSGVHRGKELAAQPAQERNFCSRCGKRTADLTVIHTCTPPQENT